ncbi:MAG: aldo/keto reductase [Deinococcales bacterium]|jgi:aryl-alcohol dehydrogenase-like predicted oxidoreductase
MQTRRLGRTGFDIGEVGFGSWAIGGSWGQVSEEDALETLRAALDNGVTFLDTADVYGDGRSERLIRRVLEERDRPEGVVVATKAGRRLDPHVASGYDYEHLSRFARRSLDNLGVEALDLLQLHCPPTDVYRADTAFEALDRMKAEGMIRHYGVSVETVEEADLAVDHEGVETVQIIYNMFRFKPADAFFPKARQRDVGVIVRVPLASGLLSGKMTRDSQFAPDDHRAFNRQGEAFDVGETFSGVDFETGLTAVEELKPLVPRGATLAQLALRWILMHPAVSVVIPGARRPDQVHDNVRASELPPLPPEAMQRVRQVYDAHIRAQVHERW